MEKEEKNKNEEIKDEENNVVQENSNLNNEDNKKLYDDLKIEYDDLNDRYKRILAEFENYKKRSQKEKDGIYGMITGDVVATMLQKQKRKIQVIKTE